MGVGNCVVCPPRQDERHGDGASGRTDALELATRLDRIQQGQIGDITTLRSYRLVGPAGFTGPKPNDLSGASVGAHY
jgi:hypothetical protein